MSQFFFFPIEQFFDNSGNPLNAGTVDFYAAGTTTRQDTFTDSTGATPSSNPIVLDSAGRAQIWLSASAYKFVVKTSGGSTLLTVDNLNPTNVNTTVTQLTNTGALTMQQSTAATSGANQSSNALKIQGTYWDGSSSQNDTWQLQDVLGSGTNPTSTLTVTHSGSSGAAQVSLPGFSGNAKNLSSIRFADQFSGASVTAKIDNAISDLGTSGLVIIPSNMGDGLPTSVPAEVILVDYRGATLTSVEGSNTITYNGQTAGVKSWVRRSWIRNNPDRSCELCTDVATYTGAMPTGTQSVEGPTFTGQTQGAITTPGTTDLLGSESVGQIDSTGGTLDAMIGHQGACVTVASSTTNATKAVGVRGLGVTKGGTGTITNNYALEGTQTSGGTNNYSLHAGGSIRQDNSTRYDIDDSGGTPQPFFQTDGSNNTFLSGIGSGFFRFLSKASGGTTWFQANPGSALFQFDPNLVGINVEFGTGAQINTSTGFATVWGGQNTVGAGLPGILAKVDLTAQSAAIGATNLIASTPAAGMYEVSYVATVTTAATTSSTLGGTVGFRLQYTDNDTSVVKLTNMGTPVVSTGNATSTQISGVLVANCKASTALQYAFDYTSSGATAMQYNLHIKVKYLGN